MRNEKSSATFPFGSVIDDSLISNLSNVPWHLLKLTRPILLISIIVYLLPLPVSFGYILNGFFVGWSSQFFSFDEELSSYVSLTLILNCFFPSRCIVAWQWFFVYFQFNRSQISWIISGFPLGVVIISLLLLLDRNKLYYLIGTKLSLLGASLLILVSWTLVMPFG